MPIGIVQFIYRTKAEFVLGTIYTEAIKALFSPSSLQTSSIINTKICMKFNFT